MLDVLNTYDEQLFLLLNGLHNSFFDVLMWWISSKLIWIPLYLFLLFLIVKNYGWETVAILLSVAILIALTDQASGWIKETVARFRPSHNPAIELQVHTLRGYFGGSYGFVSSHAANSFALAYFMWSFLKKSTPYVSCLFVWAFIVAYSRIYLGVHYPGDILGGAILGLLLAMLVVGVYKKIIGKLCFSNRC